MKIKSLFLSKKYKIPLEYFWISDDNVINVKPNEEIRLNPKNKQIYKNSSLFEILMLVLLAFSTI